MEINNDVERFSVLENCTVIEGYLKIVLIDYPNKTYDDLHFPGLREVTEYLLIYRVRGLKTLRNIFPNLAVIRGKTLARNYALVIFDNPDLEEIGLIGLTHITRGAVYIWKNNLLCYVDTISWNRITHKDFGPINSIKENKAEDQCANQCPSANSNNKCPTFYHLRMRDMCWTETDCQKGSFT
jgi:insulin receptor